MRSFWQRNRWLMLRRSSQLLILALFLIGPLLGIWWVKGTLASSFSFDFLPLTDPMILLQTWLAGHTPERQAVIGAALVLGVYLIVGGRVFCSWVCPVNLITDLAHWCRRRWGLKAGQQVTKNSRYWLLAGVLLLSFITQTVAWEWVNPVTGLQRGMLFGMGLAWTMALAIFVYDTFLVSRGWCGHWCPVGAFYGLLGKVALLRVTAPKRHACDDCMQCFYVCPEPQVIRTALKGQGSPVIVAGECSNCARCIDVCDQNVFKISHRFNQHTDLPL
ncbi:quinol dehydrogenase ferredoxin subunit NapH [Deefgea salmonis]|uniref:Quinol dehydrogenase ferredoxin subunit NapH n=1 Tax=Deefgea salmonis TaxID=2875502 RepID=A0ABS8BNU7_9NEIS|nr:quinol dehydrogenase ferredoxin subunit NapH [Deefgea salmonis]MCB5197151.1 quinol dehydrogenase ferredoxin subunit NapH [Deefgea salmonis]